jgi:pilus assembly protein Flp/PilA
VRKDGIAMQNIQQPPRVKTVPVKAFWHDDSGATAIEYALIASLVAVVIIGAITGLGSSLSAKYNATSNAIQ